jgi:hypothetical protein
MADYKEAFSVACEKIFLYNLLWNFMAVLLLPLLVADGAPDGDHPLLGLHAAAHPHVHLRAVLVIHFLHMPSHTLLASHVSSN